MDARPPKCRLAWCPAEQAGSNGRSSCFSEWEIQGSYAYVTRIERRVGYQDSDLRTDDLDFRREVFWGGIWKSMWRYGSPSSHVLGLERFLF